MTERVNRTLKSTLSIFAHSRPKSWDKEVHNVAVALRTLIKETTDETLSFITFGKNPKLPLDLKVGKPISCPPQQQSNSLESTNTNRT